MIDKANILVIEDQAQMPSGCQFALTAAGHTTTYNTGSYLLRDVELSSFNVVLMDFERAGPERLSLLEKIRQRQSALEIIAITKEQSPTHIKIAARFGASDFISKPLNPSAVTRVVKQALERSAWTIRPTRPKPGSAGLSRCWVEYAAGRQATIGLQRRFLKSIDKPIYVQLPLIGQYIPRDTVLFRILTMNGQIQDVNNPVTGRVIRVNEALLQDLDEIRDGGWAIRMQWESPTPGQQERRVHHGA